MGADYMGGENPFGQRETGLGEEKELKKGFFSKVLISLIIAANVVFVVAVLVIFCSTYAEPSTLIMAWFGFSTGELWALAFVKKSKLKKEEKKEYGSERKFDYGEESGDGKPENTISS